MIVCIDPGHGGHDPGSVNGQNLEKHINLAISEKVKKMLIDRGFTVKITRINDSYVSLEDRVKDSRGCDMFISIHANSVNRPEPAGIETFYCIESAISKQLADYIQSSLISLTGAIDRGIKAGTYYNIRKQPAGIPACLVEVGFISNPAECSKLQDDKYQLLIAEGIVAGVMKYLNLPYKDKVKFFDVNQEDWAYDYIRKITDARIMTGYPDGSFKPEKEVTRRELAAALAILLNL